MVLLVKSILLDVDSTASGLISILQFCEAIHDGVVFGLFGL